MTLITLRLDNIDSLAADMDNIANIRASFDDELEKYGKQTTQLIEGIEEEAVADHYRCQKLPQRQMSKVPALAKLPRRYMNLIW